jgi:hypothetical protein
VPSEFLVA